MIKLKVNDIDLEVEEGLTVLQACEKAGIEMIVSSENNNVSEIRKSASNIALKFEPISKKDSSSPI